MGLTGSLSRVFLYSLNSVEVTGLQRFLDILDKREDADKRQRGLLTGKPASYLLYTVAENYKPPAPNVELYLVCNHISVYVALNSRA